jgi:hypothetical protein
MDIITYSTTYINLCLECEFCSAWDVNMDIIVSI